MKKITTTFFLTISSFFVFSQSIDKSFCTKKMKKDLEVFKEIRIQANSGLYKYRTKKKTDSIYMWADKEIERASTYLDFYNIICKLTDFEGSLHNHTDFPNKYWKYMQKESFGYFPYPIKWIEGKWRVNFQNEEIPLDAEIVSINGNQIYEIVNNLYKYYTTDGENITGKRIGLRTHFSKYYRWDYGLKTNFNITFKKKNTNVEQTISLKGISYSDYYKNFRHRHSKPYDEIYYTELEGSEKYNFTLVNRNTALLTIYSFTIGGNENSKQHKNYLSFLDSIFIEIKNKKIENLILDVRHNGGGTDPNDLVTYSYLAQRNFQENKKAWISFNKIPLSKYYDTFIPKFIRPLILPVYNKKIENIFPIEKGGKYYQDKDSDDHKIRTPNKNAFEGNIYLLISPAVASAGSLFASMLAGNKNTTTIGEETMGGYYGHNGHTSFSYKLPMSKILVTFSIVNLEQDVPKKTNQKYNRGIIPDHNIPQTLKDFLNNEDTQMNFTLKLIKKNHQ